MELTNFKIIENNKPVWECIDYTEFEKDFLNPRVNVQTLRKKYDLSTRKYRELREKIFQEHHIDKKPYMTMKNQTIIIDNNTYIHNYKDKYYFIQKKINGKRKSYGIYKDMETARYVRNKLIEYEWDTNKARELKKEYSIPNTTQYEEAIQKEDLFHTYKKDKLNMKTIKKLLHLNDYQYNLLEKRYEGGLY